jgi:hypothetical protein
MLNCIDIYSFIPVTVSGCASRAPSALLCLGAYNVFKTPLEPMLGGFHQGLWFLTNQTL